MKSLTNFIIKPKEGERYNNVKKVGEKELILNTNLQDHRYVNRTGVVISTPILEKTDIEKGDEVIVHHNIFRRFHDIKGVEKNSKSFYEDNMYFAWSDQVFLFKKPGSEEWKAPLDYSFVKPIENKNSILGAEKEHSLVGILKYTNSLLEELEINVGDIVGFTPSSEYEFIIDGERLYRVLTKSITIKYGRQNNETEYNPSWAESSRGVNQSS